MTLKEIAAKFGCLDGGCVFGHPGGQHTNGGCHCLVGLSPAKSAKTRKAIHELRKELATYENE